MTPRRDLHLARVSLIGICLLTASFHSVAASVQISFDPFTNAGSQHQTEVEPHIYAYGSTIVGVFQQGRVFDGGCSDIGFATSTDYGITWQADSLPGITVWAGGGRYQRVSDPSVTFNEAFGVWLIESLPFDSSPHELFVSRSVDGLNWDDPVTVATGGSYFDKPWITCDNWPTSPFYGNCYIEWDDAGAGDLVLMSTSTDGGATWSPALTTAGQARGLGGQPLALPSGRLVVPYAGGSGVRSFFSDDGGNSWGPSMAVASVAEHGVAGGIRNADLPSAAIDGDGTLYVAWSDCRFRTSCHSNDIVFTTTSDGETWSNVARIPIDDVASSADHFLPGFGADRNSFAPSVGLAVVYYYYPDANCSASTCQLTAGFITSQDGGNSWSSPADVGGPMLVSWIANTNQGRMVGDYFATFYTDDGVPHPIFGAGTPPLGMLFQSMYSTCVDCPSPSSKQAPIASSNQEASPVNEEWPAGPAQSPSGALRVSAEAYRVNIGALLPLKASGPATDNGALHWEVEEGAAGGSASGGGVYAAPLSPGVYHVIASSGAERARLAIKVFTVR